ncbi:MAG: hypothetical protein JSS49_22070 [Planctomycetes bacterium]|nr:hypothetical protein [Planctomycetota bacterium]
MSTHRIVRLLLLSMLIGIISQASAQEVAPPPFTIRPSHAWTNLFAGRSVQFDCQVASRDAGLATMLWSVSLNRAVLRRGEIPVTMAPDKPVDVSVEFELPGIRPGVIVPAALELELVRPDGKRFSRTIELQVFSPEVTATREQWFKNLELSVFDPGRKTRATLDGMKIPYRTVDAPKPQLTGGILIYGEGMEAARLKVSWQGAIETAASGRRVIVLASNPGSIPLDGLLMPGEVGESAVVPGAVSLRRNDRIREFDKFLDSTEWPAPGQLNVASLNVLATPQGPRIEFRDEAAGWNWLDVRYPNGGRLVWTGVGLIESWETTPAARYLFVKLLEDLTDEKTEGGSKHGS